MVGLAGALVLNIGTLSPPWVEAMLAAGRAANARGIPVVLDPVGAGATRYRTETAKRILDERRRDGPARQRGRGRDARRREAEVRGVESIDAGGDPAELAREAARTLGVVASVTGPVDHVSDGERSLAVANGHELLATVTGTGCMSTRDHRLLPRRQAADAARSGRRGARRVRRRRRGRRRRCEGARLVPRRALRRARGARPGHARRAREDRREAPRARRRRRDARGPRSRAARPSIQLRRQGCDDGGARRARPRLARARRDVRRQRRRRGRDPARGRRRAPRPGRRGRRARREAGLVVGRSAWDVGQALAAERAGAAYLGAGPVWATPSKPDADPPIGLDGSRGSRTRSRSR